MNNLWNPRIAPRGGEHVFNGGIYRDVSLIVKEKVHVAWYGTRVTMLEVSAEKARIVAETELENILLCRQMVGWNRSFCRKGKRRGRMGEGVFHRAGRIDDGGTGTVPCRSAVVASGYAESVYHCQQGICGRCARGYLTRRNLVFDIFNLRRIRAFLKRKA